MQQKTVGWGKWAQPTCFASWTCCREWFVTTTTTVTALHRVYFQMSYSHPHLTMCSLRTLKILMAKQHKLIAVAQTPSSVCCSLLCITGEIAVDAKRMELKNLSRHVMSLIIYLPPLYGKRVILLRCLPSPCSRPLLIMLFREACWPAP